MTRAIEDKNYQGLRNVIEKFEKRRRSLWKLYKNDPVISKYVGVFSELSVVRGLVFYKDMLVPPFVMQKAFVDKAHSIGHFWEKSTVEKLRERVWFLGMMKMAKGLSRVA